MTNNYVATDKPLHSKDLRIAFVIKQVYQELLSLAAETNTPEDEIKLFIFVKINSKHLHMINGKHLQVQAIVIVIHVHTHTYTHTHIHTHTHTHTHTYTHTHIHTHTPDCTDLSLGSSSHFTQSELQGTQHTVQSTDNQNHTQLDHRTTACLTPHAV